MTPFYNVLIEETNFYLNQQHATHRSFDEAKLAVWCNLVI